MPKGKVFTVVIVVLFTGFAGGFFLRPAIMSPRQTTADVTSILTASEPVQARGTKYFVDHIEEARRIVAGCRDGSMRGEECTNAEHAVAEADGRGRFKNFMGH